jgi:DNA-binding NarL/FixJ family response regulator
MDAIRQAEALHPEVILMDLEMPEMDGYEAARLIKTRLPDCRVILLTIHDEQENREKCALAGMDDFFVKGASMDALLQAIRRSGEYEEGDVR